MEYEYPKDEFGKRLKKDNKHFIATYFDIDECLNFCWNHRVEILLQNDLQYHCYIDYPENTDSYGIENDAFTSMVVGITRYMGVVK